MENILTQEELVLQLNNFRITLQDFDYSAIKNITFLNLDSLYCYIENVENNPFKLQYNKLQQILDIIEPYIPFPTENKFINTLDFNDFNNNYGELENLKTQLSLQKRNNFINLVKMCTNNEDWSFILELCKDIRDSYEKTHSLR